MTGDVSVRRPGEAAAACAVGAAAKRPGLGVRGFLVDLEWAPGRGSCGEAPAPAAPARSGLRSRAGCGLAW